MSSGTRRAPRFAIPRRPGAVVLVLALVAALVAAALLAASPKRTVTVYFTSAPALYEGNPVEVLGVPVGSVSEITPEAKRVKVVLSLDADVTLPADVTALQVAPSLITGRSIALEPAYDGGPRLADGAVIPETRSAVPLDVNDLYESANKLATALGPDGANRTGSLSRALDVAAANLKGNGGALAAALRDLSGATGTLAAGSKDLTGTVRGLQTFVTTLADDDPAVRTLLTRLATVSGFLADDRDELGAALRDLSLSLGEVADFVKDNRSLLRSNVDRLSAVSGVLVKQRATLGSILDEAPAGLTNLYNAYDAAGGTLDVRLSVNELMLAPGALVCELVNRATPNGLPKALVDLCAGATGVLNGVPNLADLLATLQGTPPAPAAAKAGGR